MKPSVLIYDARHIEMEQSGLGRYSASVLLALIRASHETDILILLREGVDYEHNIHFNRLKTENSPRVKFIYTAAPLFGLRHHLLLPFWLKKFKATTYFYPHFDLPILHFASSKFVIHDLLPLIVKDYIQRLRWVKRLFFRTVILINLIKRKSVCIAVSQSTKKDLGEYFGKRFQDKIQVAYEGPFLEFRDSVVFEPESSMDSMPPYLLYVGDRRPHKNLKKMIDLFLELKKNHQYPGILVIAGSRQNFTFDVDQYVRTESSIRLLGVVSESQLVSLYKHMDALLFLTKYEGFGLPVVEAAYLNRPIITSNCGATAEIAPTYALLLPPTDSPSRLASAVAKYLSSSQHADLDLNYLEHYSWKKTAHDIFLTQ